MSSTLLLDWRYVSHVSSTLDKFKQCKPNLARARCNICGDSEKNRIITRLYFIERNNKLFIYCHNCGWSGSMYNFLELTNPALHKEYRMEWVQEHGTFKKNIKSDSRPDTYNPPPKKTNNKNVNLVSISKLADDHFCKLFCINRSIPEFFFEKHLFYTPDFKGVAALFDVESSSNLKENDPRLVIPFYDINKKVVAVQGRALSDSSKPKYITIKKSEDTPKLYGLDRLDESLPVYVVEGPIDSFWIPNSVATCDSSLTKYDSGDYYIFDNQPRNREIVNQISKAIQKGKRVVIWPEDWKEKDINDMVSAGRTPEEILNTINNNSYDGLKAKFMLSKWKRI